MMRESMDGLVAFLGAARKRSFTRATAELGVRLLTRTTRSVSTTEPGGRLLK